MTPSRFDHDPEALAWARAKVQAEIDRAEKFVQQATAQGATEGAEFWSRHALHLHRSFVGGEGCVMGRFDERRPALVPAGVAPASDRAALLRELADQQEATAATDVIRKRRSIATARRLFAVELRRMAAEERDEQQAQANLDQLADLLPPTPDRAIVLREVADRYQGFIDNADTGADPRYWTGIRDMVIGLRHMAAETRNTTETDGEAPFIPSAHYRRDDGVECCVHTIPVGPDSCPACRELLVVEEPAAGPTVLDEVVAALQAKAQSLSVDAEEEMRRDLEDQAQVWHEAAEVARSTGRKAQRRNTTPPAGGAQQPKEA